MTRDELLQRLRDVLPSWPGVTEAHLTGSLGAGKADAYSDIDLYVVAEDLPAAIAARHGILAAVGDIVAEWRVPVDGPDCVPTVLFRDASCYYKVDLALSPDPPPEGALCLWRPESFASQTEPPPAPTVYSPELDSPGHFLLGQLLGGVRYAKSRRRGHGLTCWRFASAMVEWLAALAHEQATEWRRPSRKLSTWEYAELDSHTGLVGPEPVFSKLDWSTPGGMDRGVLWLLHKLVALVRLKAEALGETIPDEPVEHVVALVEGELGGRARRQR